MATEDARFWTNPGIDPAGALRALLAPLRGGESDGGGATIEQQLAKMLYTAGQRIRTDQIEQVALALKLAHRYTNSQILEMYLATAYFGNGCYGLEAASQCYLHAAHDRLDRPQAALLAGLVQAPSAYDPVLHPQLALRGSETAAVVAGAHSDFSRSSIRRLAPGSWAPSCLTDQALAESVRQVMVLTRPVERRF